MPTPSYYFTLFKRFESLGHRAEATYHGGPGGFMSVEFRNADKLYTLARGGTPLIGTKPGMPTDTPPGDTPIWMVLNAKAMGLSAFTYNSLTWNPMPYDGLGDVGWADIGGAPLVSAIGAWLTAGKPNDYPRFIQLPGAASPGGETPGGSVAVTTGGGPIVFVCSSPTDDGTRPGIPSNFWATSLIHLVNPASTSAEAFPATLHKTDEYYIAAVIGNRGDTGGKYANGPGSVSTGPQIQAQAWVLVFGTGGASPAVQLQSLEKLSYVGAMPSDGIWDQYFLDSGTYDICGFRLNVQEAFNGCVAAINAAVAAGKFVLPTGVTAEQYVETAPSHCCVKVAVSRDDATFPANDASPLTEPRIAQKNLVPFDIDLGATAGAPSWYWKYFTVGQPLAMWLRGFRETDEAIGINTLILQNGLAEFGARAMIAVPEATFERWMRKNAVQGFEVIARDCRDKFKVPFPDHVVLRAKGEKNGIRLPFLEDHMLAMAIGVEIDPKRLKPGVEGHVTVAHRTTIPVFGEKRRCYEVEDGVVGGITLEFRFKKHEIPKRPKEAAPKGGRRKKR